MYDKILKQLRDLVRSRRYVMTVHAEEEMSDDDLTIFDVERAVLTGQIVERQKDGKTGEAKYLVKGRSITNGEIAVVAKLGASGRLVFITVYAT